jgi:TolB protein
MKIVFAILLVLFCSLPVARAEKIYIDITSASDRSFPIALVPPIQDGGSPDAAKYGEQFAESVKKDLELMAVFKFIPQGAFLEDAKKKTYTAGDIDFASWALLDALAITKGWYKINGKKLTIEARLFDVLLKKELIAKKYDGTVDDVPIMAHRFANAIIQVITGEPGLFETQIAFIGERGKNKEVYVMDFNGANQRQLTHHNALALSPNWAKDGKGIFYTLLGSGGSQLYRYDFKGGTTTRKTNFPGMVIGLKLDPISDFLATTLTKDGNPEIYFLDQTGREQTRLTLNNDIDVSPSFSPDGQQVVFVSNRDGSAQIYKMDRGGKNVQRLTFKGNNNTSPVWSPKGDRIAFAGMDTDGQFDIFTMNTTGGDMLRLTYDTRNNEDPSWSSDGQMIVFTSSRTRQNQLYIMRPDGTHQVQISSDPWKHTMPVWGPKK